jgi:large subunit ribosomal protein L29
MAADQTKIEIKELRGHSDEELHNLTRSLTEELFKFRMQRYTNQLENTMQIRKLRRDIARVQTILSGRKAGIETRQDGGAQPEEKAAAPAAKKATKAKAKKAPAKRKKSARAEAQE